MMVVDLVESLLEVFCRILENGLMESGVALFVKFVMTVSNIWERLSVTLSPALYQHYHVALT